MNQIQQDDGGKKLLVLSAFFAAWGLHVAYKPHGGLLRIIEQVLDAKASSDAKLLAEEKAKRVQFESSATAPRRRARRNPRPKRRSTLRRTRRNPSSHESTVRLFTEGALPFSSLLQALPTMTLLPQPPQLDELYSGDPMMNAFLATCDASGVFLKLRVNMHDEFRQRLAPLRSWINTFPYGRKSVKHPKRGRPKAARNEFTKHVTELYEKALAAGVHDEDARLRVASHLFKRGKETYTNFCSRVNRCVDRHLSEINNS
jgi:hypothetical protein